ITLIVIPAGPEEVSCCARVQFEHGQCVRTRVSGSAGPPAPPPGPRGGAPPPRPPAPEREREAPPPAPRPVLRIRKVGPPEVARYDIFNYKIEVRNVGRAAARGVVVRDTLPKGITFLNSKPAEESSSPLVWKLGELAPGKTQAIDCQVVAKENGTLT